MSNPSLNQKGGLKRLFIAVAIPQNIAEQLHKVQENAEKTPDTKH